MKVPTVLRDAKHNVEVTAGVPDALTDTLESATEALSLLQSAAAGPG